MDEMPRIGSCMKRNVVFVQADTTVGEAVNLMIDKSVGTLPVVDREGTLIGVTNISDIIQIFLPDFVSLISDISFVKDYGTLRAPTQESLNRVEVLTVAEIMDKPRAVEEDGSLIRALAIMHKHNLRDVPVLKAGKLVGLASTVDIGRAFLADWSSRTRADEESD